MANPVYVHKPQTLRDIHAWLSSLPRLATGAAKRLRRRLKSAAGHLARTVIVQPVATPSSASSPTFASFSVSLAHPVIVLPEAASGEHSHRVLICRLGQLQLATGEDFTRNSRSSLLATIEHASLSSLDMKAGVPSVWGISEAVKAMLGLAHYRGIVRSKSEILIIEDVSADFKVGSILFS